MILLPESENRMIVASFVWTQYWNVTDRQTDTAMANTAVALQAMRTRCKQEGMERKWKGRKDRKN